MAGEERRPIGYFCHHQGRGHALRAAALVNALPPARPVTLFCARPEILPPLRAGAEVVQIPSLFEPTGAEAPGLDRFAHPQTTHCAPLGWPTIRSAMARLTLWFETAEPVLFISDVSAEVAQLARLCSVPHVCVLQHGDRSDPGHRAAYDGAVGLIAPFAAALMQDDWPESDRAKTQFAPGLGVDATPAASPAQAPSDRARILVMTGGGGTGWPEAPLAGGARALPEADWTTIGHVQRDWHATPPGNLSHLGWVDDADARIAAADLVISSTGNATCHQVLAAGKPWIAIPEWRYFDEQAHKAAALARAGAALHLPTLPSAMHAWRDAIDRCREGHDPARQAALLATDPAGETARWIEALIADLWPDEPTRPLREEDTPMRRRSAPRNAPRHSDRLKAPPAISVLTIAKGRQAHLGNLIRGLAAQTRKPEELVIGVMQEARYTDLPEAPFPIRQVLVLGADALPLAEARNAAARAARADRLVFLDVDCIPGPDLLADYARALDEVGEGLVMGEVLYLPDGAAEEGPDFALFDRLGVRHSDRAAPPDRGQRLCTDYRCFWSLTFAISREDWDRSGGFDESFTGYGGEDTDFGRTLDALDIPIWWTRGARAYHQYHPHAMPPVHHLRSVIRNAERFAEKWGYRTMEHWLYAFQLMGLIDTGPRGIRVLREPGPADFELCAQPSHMPYAATRRVIDHLQQVGDDSRFTPGRAEEVERAQDDLKQVAAE